MDDKKTCWQYRVIRWLVWLFSPKYKLVGTENIPKEPCVIVGNHSQMFGPIAGELYTPGKHYVWCIAEMMNRKEVPAYAFQDFWSGKPKWNRWFYKLLSYLIGPLAELVFTNAHTIPVYHDARVISTFRESMDKLQEGSHIVIFPEHYDEHNNIVHDFQDKFIDLARLYYRKTGTILKFVPLYVAPRLKTLYYGKPVTFLPDVPIAEERKRICNTLMDEITDIAVSLPEHTVVPYPNIPKRLYPKNRPSASSGKKRVDYSGFSLRRLKEPRFSHMLLLIGWPVYFALYFLTENLIPEERCHVIHCALDDMIPFREEFVIFYVGWYVLVFGALAYTLFYDVESFKKVQTFIMITQAVGMICYIIWPSVQNLRPEVFPRKNIFTWAMGVIYAFDTPTGVCPSLHAAYSIGILSVALKDKDLSRKARTALTVFVVMICLAVCFVKQHSAVDVAAALPVCLLAEVILYGKDYWKPRLGL